MKNKFYGMFFSFMLVVFLAGAAWDVHGNPGQGDGGSSGALQEKDFSHLLGMDGFSEDMLNDHFALYRGYVVNSNKLVARLSRLLEQEKTKTPEFAELKRRLGWEINGVKLHEYYFGNLGGTGDIDAEGELYKRIVRDFGSFDEWKKDFIATGSMRGIGWVILGWEPSAGRLLNVWVEEHDMGYIAGLEPVLVMDVFEHSYMTDYRLDRAGYMEAFFRNIDWDEAGKRYR